MQIPPSVKDFLAVFLALLYLLSPLNEEILEISHVLSHKISKTLSAHEHNPLNSHPGVSFHKPETHKHIVHTEKHTHDVLEFISSALSFSDGEQVPFENTKKETYDKHLIESYSPVQHHKRTKQNSCSAYIHSEYSHFTDNLFPPPEPDFHKI